MEGRGKRGMTRKELIWPETKQRKPRTKYNKKEKGFGRASGMTATRKAGDSDGN